MENNNNGSKRNNEDYELAVSMQDQFMKEHNVMDYANGCGIGLIGPDKVFGYHVYFPSKEELTNFPFKEDNYQGIPIEKTVIGVTLRWFLVQAINSVKVYLVVACVIFNQG